MKGIVWLYESKVHLVIMNKDDCGTIEVLKYYRRVFGMV